LRPRNCIRGECLEDIAVYICCYRGDRRLVKTLCESIRYFCGQIPIFLIKDGEFSTAQVRQLGCIYEFNQSRVPEALRGLQGWSMKKLFAFFQTDHERFLYLDSDIVLLRDPRLLPSHNFDFFVDTCGFQNIDANLPGIRFRGTFPAGAAKYTFDPTKIISFDGNFDLNNVLLFNAGQIFGRSGLLDINLTLKCVNEFKKNSNIFFWDQGILNFLLNKGHQEGRFTLGGECFRIPGYEPPGNWPALTPQAVLNGDVHDRTLIHWAGPSKRSQELPYGSILEAFQTLYYRRLPPFAYPLDVARDTLATRFRALVQRLSRVRSVFRHHP
jgi:hypothetical protein